MTDASEAAEERLTRVRERIAAAARRSGREPESVTLVGVSKRQPLERVVAAVRAGVEVLGENYVQEARARRLAVEAALGEEASGLRWHMVGPLQRNKAARALEIFDVIETLDRESLADELDKRAAAQGRRLPVLLQVNISREPQKNGVAPEAATALLERCAALSSLEVVGLMGMPAAADPEVSRPAFRALRELRDRLRDAPGGEALRELSMGMSADFEVAIEEGATWVRVGTALFGAREERP